MEWELYESGPSSAAHGVLLLPGGGCTARQWTEVMAEPALAAVHCVAATLPGHAGAPPPDDLSVENYARLAAALADEKACDVVVGFSMGAVVALEMVAGGYSRRPAVLTGISLQAKAEPAAFIAMIRLGSVLGTLPARLMVKAMPSFAKHAKVSPERQVELADDFRRNQPSVMRRTLKAYLDYANQRDDAAERLCAAGVPVWIVHAEKKGDGKLVGNERAVLEACPHATVVTIPSESFMLPNEKPAEIASMITDALHV